MEMLTIQSSLPTPAPIINSSSSLPKHFTLLAQQWKLNIRRIPWNGHGADITRRKILAHVVKENEETCISKLEDAVPIYEIVDDDTSVLNNRIPSALAEMCYFEGNRLHRITTSFGIHGRQRLWNQICSVVTPCRLPVAKTTVSFLLLVPLLAFCIMAALQNRAGQNTRHRPAKKSQSQGHPNSNTNSMRWKTALADLQDPEEALDTESEPEPEPELHSGLFTEEDKEQFHFEGKPNKYTKLEEEYQKFLSDCGMSKWGYWRGGSGSSSQE